MGKGISISCCIKNNQLWLNDALLFEATESDSPPVFFSALYKHLHLSYPKFFKMDSLSKLGFLATEVLIQNIPAFPEMDKNKIALVFSNYSSSLESDENHAKSISDKSQYFPSPAVFVYTLPNIVMGEIAIRHKITGENAFFVAEKFDRSQLDSYADLLFAEDHTTSAICGWVEYHQNNYKAFVYYREKGTFNK